MVVGVQILRNQGVEGEILGEQAAKAAGYKSNAEKIKEEAQTVPPKNPHGTNQHSNLGVDNSENVNSSQVPKGGNKAAYRLAKLKRDHPDIADRVANGEFKSVAMAERVAGIKPPLPTRIKLNPIRETTEIVIKSPSRIACRGIVLTSWGNPT